MKTFYLPLIIPLVVLVATILYRYFKYNKIHITSYFHAKFVIGTDLNISEATIFAMKKSNFKNVKKNNNKFSGFTIPSIWSWSEKILIEYDIDENKNYEIKFHSTCFFPFQIFDWGKNKANYFRFKENLSLDKLIIT